MNLISQINEALSEPAPGTPALPPQIVEAVQYFADNNGRKFMERFQDFLSDNGYEDPESAFADNYASETVAGLGIDGETHPEEYDVAFDNAFNKGLEDYKGGPNPAVALLLELMLKQGQ